MATATLKGTVRKPYLELRFNPRQSHATRKAKTLLDFVKALPDRRWSPEDRCWIVTGTGPDPDGKFERAGFTVIIDDENFPGIESLSELLEPITHLSSTGREVFIRPRFIGRQRTLAALGGTAAWDAKRDRYVMSVAGILHHGKPREGISFSDEAIDAAHAAAAQVAVDDAVAAPARILAQAKDDSEIAEHVSALIDSVGDVPDWFGLDLFPYQRLGALAAAAGQSFIADEPGLGKCMDGQTRLPVSGRMTTLRRLWDEHAGGRAYADPEGDAGELIDLAVGEVLVRTIDAETRQVSETSASHLYRQRYGGRLHTITLANGTRIRCTARHRVLTDSGWVRARKLAVGALVAADDRTDSPTYREVVANEVSVFDGFVYDLSVPVTRSYSAEGVWVHNTRQALACAALSVPRRLLIVGPPVSLTNWEREVTASGLAHVIGGTLTDSAGSDAGDDFADEDTMSVATPGATGDLGGFTAAAFSGFASAPVNKIVPGRKVRDFPDAGVLIVSDDTVKSRPDLLADIVDWQPQVMIVDEIHRLANWDSKRSEAVRKLAYATKTRVIGLSGTPLDRSPEQLASPMEITGHLTPVFGGREAYLSEYCRQDRFGNWLPRKRELARLGTELDANVWVRRTKAEVLPFLPKKARRLEWVDVGLAEYRHAHRETLMKLGLRAKEFHDEKSRRPTSERELTELVGDAITMSSAMRTAAGLAKVDVLTERVLDHIAATDSDDAEVWDRPLILWLHNKPVAKALEESLAAAGLEGVRTISGQTPASVRDEIVDSFQAGAVPVLLASITAANTAITLTRCADLIFGERDWRPPQITQAEDRAVRIGQTRPVTITTVCAVDTLDQLLEATLVKKGNILKAILPGADAQPSEAGNEEADSLTAIMVRMASDAVKGEKSGKLAEWRAKAAAEAAQAA